MESKGSPARSKWRLVVFTCLGIVALLSGLLVASPDLLQRFWHPTAAPMAVKNRQGLDLSAPDALIETEHLSQLPKDLISAPFLADLLSDDFVFYYQHNAEKLAVIGTLRRLAFERDLSIPEQLISQILDTPAQVALWKTPDGKLSLSLARLELGLAAPLAKALTSVIAALTPIAQGDKQLGFIGDITINKNKVAFFSLRYLTNRTLAFGFYQGSLIVASHLELLQTEANRFNPAAETLINQLLTQQQPFKNRFNLPDTLPKSQARISLAADFFTLGYQAYVPALAAVRFELTTGQWQSFLALNKGEHAAQFNEDLWAKTPADASLCALLPVNPAALSEIISQQNQNPQITQAFTGRSFICWFANAPLATPLIGAELTSEGATAELDSEISALFDKTIRNTKLPKTSDDAGNVTSAGGYAPSNLAHSPLSNGHQWQKSDSNGKPLATLARADNVLLFSLQATLVKHGLDTLAKRYPSLADKLPTKKPAALFLNPPGFAALIQSEMRQRASDAALGPLLPKLAALGKQAAFFAQFDADEKARTDMHWYPLQWNKL